MITRDIFDKMDEAKLREDVIVPLLRAMDYKDVFLYHGGAGEQGKDVVCWKTDDLGSRENLAIVAKAVQMSGKAKLDTATAAEVQTQIRQCFGKPFNDPVSSEPQSVHRVWVVSNKKITKEAKEAIKSAVDDPDKMKNVRFVDGDGLWILVEKHLPVSVLPLIEEIRRHSQSDSHYVSKIIIGSEQTFITLVEKFPGAANEKPINISTRIDFPSQEEAANFQKSFQQLVETGEPLEVPGEHIAGFDMPQFARTMLGIDALRPLSLRLSSTQSWYKPPVRIRFLCDDGDEFICHFVRLSLMRAGTKEMTLVNEEGDAPFLIQLMLRLDGKEGNFSVTPWKVPYNALQYREFLKAWACLTKRGLLQIDSLELGARVLEAPLFVKNLKPLPPQVLNFAEYLATIQQKIGTPIMLPMRDFTQDEMNLVVELYTIVTTGRMELKNNRFDVHLLLTAERLEGLKQTFGDGKTDAFEFQGEDVRELFGIVIPLGRIRITLDQVRLANLDAVARIYSEAHPDGPETQAQEVPAAGEFQLVQDTMIVTEYLDWTPEGAV